MRLRNKKTILVGIGIAGVIALAIVGVTGALNGWFKSDVPSDTFTRGLVAYWSFDEGSGTTAYDASGNGNHGTLINGPKWTQGKNGQALSFDGSNDYVDVPDSNSLDVTNAFTVEVWINPRTTLFVTQEIVNKGVNRDTDCPFEIFTYGTIFAVYLNNYDTGLNADVKESGKWQHFVVTYDSSLSNNNIKIFKNGSLVAQKTYTTPLIVTNANMHIGGWASGASFDGLIDEVRIYNRALSPEEIRFHYSRGGPVGYWKFDEGKGLTTYDSTTNNNNGTLNLGTSGNTSTASAWVPGKFGTALSFDGVDDYVDCGNGSSLNINPPITYEAWVKPRTFDTKNVYYFMSKGTGSGGINLGFMGTFEPTNKGKVILFNGSFSVYSANPVSVNSWHHVVAVNDGSTTRLYIDGQFSSSQAQTLSNLPTANFNIGRRGDVIWYFDGLIDEVRIYNYARTPDEIRLDYNAGYSARFGPSTDCDSDPGSCMTKGLVGYWSFDEGSGNIAYDASGNGNHGTLINGPKWSQGKIGDALQFDGKDDYVDCGNNNSISFPTNSFSVEVWLKTNESCPNDYCGWILDTKLAGTLNSGYDMFIQYGKITFRTANGSQLFSSASLSNVNDDKWHHVVGIVDRENNRLKIFVDGKEEYNFTQSFSGSFANTYPLLIGKYNTYGSGPYAFNGLIDEVRIYNRALSENEIRYHYNHTLPKGAQSPVAMKDDPSLVGYWSFNEGKGTKIYDQSGKNNNGTLYLGSSGNTDPAKAWSPGISGTALSFDGVDDGVTINNSENLKPSKVTLEAWVKSPGSPGTTKYIADKYYSSGYGSYGLYTGSSGGLKFYIGSSGTYIASPDAGTGIWDGNWHHVVGTYDGAKVRLYVDGIQVGSGTEATVSIAYNDNNFYIGSYASGSYFNGLIDEVRIYNRALSDQEIQEHYRNSKYYLASHFGPKTDCTQDPGSCMDYGLVGYWKFDEASGNIAYDSSGNNNHGTLINGPKWTRDVSSSATLRPNGGALQFDGVDDYVEVPHSASLNLTNNFTLEAWIYRNVANARHEILYKYRGTSGVDNYDFLVDNDNTLRFQFQDSGGNWRSAFSWRVVSANAWHHVAVVFSQPNVKFYIDGVETIKTLNYTPGTGNGSLRIGTMTPYGSWFNGLIDEVRIYNRALSAEEVRYHYNRGGPIAHWKFDEGQGTTVYDSSGNGNNGTLNLGTSGNTTTSAAWVPGKFGSALSFDGVDDYVAMPLNANNPNGWNEETVELWLNWNKHINWHDAIAFYADNTYIHRLEMTDQPGKFSFFYYANGVQILTVSGIEAHKWYHFTFVFKKGDAGRLYVNGVQVASAPATVSLSADTNGRWYIGNCYRYGDNYTFPGLIDDVRIYNYARSPSQILQDYNAGLSTHFK